MPVCASRRGRSISGFGRFAPRIACGLVVLLAATANDGVGASTAANDDICKARSVLEELDARDRAGLEAILRKAAQTANSEAVLWRIERPGIEPSYLFGTVHIADDSLQDLPQAVREAIARSKIVALEAGELSRRALKYAMRQAGPLMVAHDRPLERILASDELEIIERVLVKAGFPREMALGFKPWAVTMLLTDSDCQRKKQQEGLRSVDLLVAEQAKSQGLSPVGLETLVEQYESLAQLPDDVQNAWLRSSIALHERSDDMVHTIAELYRFRRIDAVWDLTRLMAPKAGMTDAVLADLKNALVGKRNVRLHSRARPLIDQGGAFIAIGAMHLIGEEGLVSQLRRDGFTVTAIN